ncbi:hypothetical protein SFUMM280S_07169 [Streptomyces fumanus]
MCSSGSSRWRSSACGEVLGVAAELNVRTAAGHVGGDRHGALHRADGPGRLGRRLDRQSGLVLLAGDLVGMLGRRCCARRTARRFSAAAEHRGPVPSPRQPSRSSVGLHGGYRSTSGVARRGRRRPPRGGSGARASPWRARCAPRSTTRAHAATAGSAPCCRRTWACRRRRPTYRRGCACPQLRSWSRGRARCQWHPLSCGRMTTFPRPATELSADEARRIALRAQGFLGAPDRRAGVRGVLRRARRGAARHHLGAGPLHELVSYARLGAVGRRTVEAAYWTGAHAFEYWSHAACVGARGRTSVPLGAHARSRGTRCAITRRGQPRARRPPRGRASGRPSCPSWWITP